MKIILHPEEVWIYFIEHEDDLNNSMILIAENTNYGIEIYLTASNGLPCIMVTADDEEIEEFEVADCDECLEIAQQVYDCYLTSSKWIGELEDERETMISDREEELEEAIYDMLLTLVPDLFDIIDPHIIDDLCADMIDHICEYLYKVHDISVYRPMYLDNNGTEEFYKNPYPEMVLGD